MRILLLIFLCLTLNYNFKIVDPTHNKETYTREDSDCIRLRGCGRRDLT